MSPGKKDGAAAVLFFGGAGLVLIFLRYNMVRVEGGSSEVEE
jgi:hypothetical protein